MDSLFLRLCRWRACLSRGNQWLNCVVVRVKWLGKLIIKGQISRKLSAARKMLYRPLIKNMYPGVCVVVATKSYFRKTPDRLPKLPVYKSAKGDFPVVDVSWDTVCTCGLSGNNNVSGVWRVRYSLAPSYS